MAAGTKFQQFVQDLAQAAHSLKTSGGHVLKLMLSLTAPVNTNAVKGDLVDIAVGNGYAAGGTAVTVTTAAQSGGTFTLAGNQVVFTASGGAFSNFRYCSLYNDTQTAPVKPLIGFWDYGATLTLNDGETFTVKFNNTDPGTILTIT